MKRLIAFFVSCTEIAMLNYSPWKTALIWFTVFVSVIIALPNAFPDEQLAGWPSWIPKNKMTLGLDLQGRFTPDAEGGTGRCDQGAIADDR